MQEEPNPVKDLLFEYINKLHQELINEKLSQKKFQELIKEIIDYCLPFLEKIPGSIEEKEGILATGILHYMLTNALIHSQRKIAFDNIDLDIVIPDALSLRKNSNNALLICIPKTSDKKKINSILEGILKIQKNKENIWLVLSEPVNLDFKQYVVSKNGSSFSKIIDDIQSFLQKKKQNPFKIMKT